MEELENKNISGIGFEGWGGGKKPRQAKEAAEGVDTTDFPREGYLGETPGAVSLTKITVSDLLSEGRIDGLVTGYHSYVGTAGETGWTSADLTEYDEAPETTVRWLRSIYWNQVPVVNPENKYNFQDVNIAFTHGLPNGSTTDVITTETASARPVGERLRYGPDFAKTYRVLNKNAKAIEINVKVTQLSKTETAGKRAGDSIDTEIVYNVFYRPLFGTPTLESANFTLAKQETILGKISYGYIRKTRIDLYQSNINYSGEPDFLGWEIKIERLTLDSTTSSIRNQSFIDSLIEVYGDVFSYPDSAIVSAKFSAEYFSQVPNRNYEVKGIQVQIPSTYEPLKRSYTPNNGDDWDGTFKTDGDGNIAKEWTDNPAWCYYDLLTNKRYGLGKYITGGDLSVDKWTLYDIGRYCDVLVSDGYGGLEPRFSCNVIINERDEAFRIVNHMASIFRGMVYYGAGTIFTIQDSPKPSYTQFTNANVENGDFLYSSSSRRVRHNVAVVRYNDKKNLYRPALEYVEDVDGIRRYGIREIELPAYGCTSRGQAVRYGRWALLTETSETESVSFTAGLEGSLVRPGDVIQISDFNRRGTRYGGRAYQIIDPSTILLDSQISNLTSNNLYNFHLLTPTYSYDITTVSDFEYPDYTGFRKPHIQTQTFLGSQATTVLGSDDVNRTRISFPNAFDTDSYSLSGSLVWMIDSSGTSDVAYDIIDYYRVIKVGEIDPLKYSISAVEYNVDKYNQIESGLNFRTQTLVDTVPTSPTDLQLNLNTLSQHVQKIDYSFDISNIDGVSKFLVYVKKTTDFVAGDIDTNQYLVNVLPKEVRSATYFPSTNDIYYFRVYSSTSKNTKSSSFAGNSITVSNLNQIQDIIIQSLILNAEEDELEETDDATEETNAPGSRESVTSVSAEPTFSWQVGFNDQAFIGQNLTGLGYRVSIREPSNSNAPNSNIYYQEVVLTGQFDNLQYIFPIETNIEVGPYRTYDVVVEAVDTHDGKSAAGGNYKLNADTTFTNSNGYDILAVTNPPIDNFVLTDGIPQATDAFKTEQWITSDGTLKVWVKEGIPPDWVGGYAYIWTGFTPFSKNEAYGIDNTDKSIVNIRFAGSGENGLITIPTGITGVSAAYLSLSPGDTFDLALLNNDVPEAEVRKKLGMSNIVQVKRRLGFDDKLLYQNWIEVSLDYVNQTLSDWTKTNVGFKDITFESYNDTLDENALRFKHNLNFSIPFPNTNYVVIAPNSGANTLDGFELTKRQDGITLKRFKGTQFLAVLYNGS